MQRGDKDCEHGSYVQSDAGVRCWDCWNWFPTWFVEGQTVDFCARGDSSYLAADDGLVHAEVMHANR